MEEPPSNDSSLLDDLVLMSSDNESQTESRDNSGRLLCLHARLSDNPSGPAEQRLCQILESEYNGIRYFPKHAFIL